MTTSVRRRISEGDESEELQRKVLRTMERQCTKETPNYIKDNICASVVSSEFGPSTLNLYLYVAEEAHFLWTKAKAMFILKMDSEPKKGLLLVHERGMDLKTFCWKQFEFDSYSTSYSSIECNSSSPSDMVCVFAFGKSFWKTTKTENLETLKESVRNVNKSHIFVITYSDEDKQHAVKFCKERQLCPLTHIFKMGSDKSLVYETMYKVLEKQLSNFLSDLKSRASATTRSVLRFTSELEILLRKLLLRKKRHSSLVTKQCIAKIKSGYSFGIVGYRLFGDVLYIFEDENVSTNAIKTIKIKKSIAYSEWHKW